MIPSGVEISVAQKATRSESATACHSSAPSQPIFRTPDLFQWVGPVDPMSHASLHNRRLTATGTQFATEISACGKNIEDT